MLVGVGAGVGIGIGIENVLFIFLLRWMVVTRVHVCVCLHYACRDDSNLWTCAKIPMIRTSI